MAIQIDEQAEGRRALLHKQQFKFQYLSKSLDNNNSSTDYFLPIQIKKLTGKKVLKITKQMHNTFPNLFFFRNKLL